MKRVVDFLTQSQVQYLATVGTDQKPKVGGVKRFV